MKNQSTNRDIQRVSFVESLHESLQKQSSKTLANHDKFTTLAKSYVSDGLSESESIELLMIDGLSREASENYVSLAQYDFEDEDYMHEYSFQFEDDYGRIWSSYDINKTVKASNDNEAMTKAQDISDPDQDIYAARIISVSRIES